MAYLLAFDTTCQQAGCRSVAKWTLMGTRNERYGTYCEKHGHRRLTELKAREARDTRSVDAGSSVSEHDQ